MKLTNAQIRTANNAYVYLNNLETGCFVEICSNIIELEQTVLKIDKFLSQVAAKGGWLSEDKTRVEIKNAKDQQLYQSQIKDFLSKTTDIKLQVIKKSQLEGLKIPGSLIFELIKLKLIV